MVISSNVYSLDHFAADVRAVVDRKLGDMQTVEEITPLLNRIVSRPDCLADRAGPADPDKGFDIYTSDDLSILGIVWQPNRGTGLHNHNGWAMVGVVKGHERNTSYHRKDDGATPWQVKLEEAETIDVMPGESAYILPPNDIHAVTIPSGKTLAIHVYGTDIRRQWRCTFDVTTGKVSPFYMTT